MLLLTIAGLSATTIFIAREQQTTKNALNAATQAKADLQNALTREQNALARERHRSYFHRITLAHGDLAADNLGGARKLLDECPPDLRGWEWSYLDRLSRVNPVEPIVAGGRIYSIAFSPDGRYVAAAREDGQIAIHGLESGDVFFLDKHEKFVFSVAFQPQGEYLVSAGADRNVILWDLRTRRPVLTTSGHEGKYIGLAYAVAFSPDGRTFAAPSDEKSVTIWSVPDGRVIRKFSDHEALVGSVANLRAR